MSLEDNNGTQYYEKPVGVVSISPNLTSNNGTSYYWLSANDYILWGQGTLYPHISSNNTTGYYFYKCNVSSDAGLNLSANNGSKYYYLSSFNCVQFEGGSGEVVVLTGYIDENGVFYFDENGNRYIFS